MPDDKNPARPVQPENGEGNAKTSPDKKGNGADPELDKAAQDSRAGMEDKLKVPGGLEVEEMDASTELQDRRKQTKNQLKNMVSDEDIGEAFQDDEGGLMDMLKESNLSPKHFKFCCGGVFVVLFLAGLVWGGIQFFGYLSDRADEKQDEVVDEVDDADAEEISQQDFANDYESLDVSVYPGIFIGEYVVVDDDATGAGQELGEELTSDDSLAEFISDFADLYESLQVNVQQLLDASHDRQASLDDYQDEMNFLLYRARQNLKDIETQALSLSDLIDVTDGEKAYYEERFFDQLRQLDTYSSVGALNDFIASSEELVRLKAQYQARVKLISYYEQTITPMETRISDITLNEEALVKGVQVVDISGSDIDLIIDESEL